LVEKYDTNSRLTYTVGPEKYFLSQWLMFQASGQGVYFGQGTSPHPLLSFHVILSFQIDE
jgi:hypothetical protein